MSFAATLTLNGMKRQLLTLNKHYFHTTIAVYQRCYDNNVYYTLKDLYQASLSDSGNYTMPPKGQPYGGILRMTMESHEDDEDLFYLFKEGRFFDGSIEIYGNGEENQIMQHIEYWDAWISDIGEHMCSTGSNPMILSMEISPATTRFNKKLLFQKSWFMTDIKQKEASDRMMAASMVGEMKIASTSASIGSVVKKTNIVEKLVDTATKVLAKKNTQQKLKEIIANKLTEVVENKEQKENSDFLPVVYFELENKSDKLKYNEAKTEKNLLVYNHYKSYTLNYNIKSIVTKPSVGEIKLKCKIDKGFEESSELGTIKFKIENITKDAENNLLFGDSFSNSYTGKIGDTVDLNLIMPDKISGGSSHNVIAYIEDKEKEIMVGKIRIVIERVGAWVIKRDWNSDDVNNFSKFVVYKLKEYVANDARYDCADLALSLLIDYSSQEGLPLELKSKTGKSYISYSEKYFSTNGYKQSIFSILGSADVSFNTFTVDKKTEAIVGDMIILTAPYGHIAIYSKIKGGRKLSYGNLATEDGNTIVPPITTKNDWSDSTSGGLKYDPDTQKAHRWNVLKF